MIRRWPDTLPQPSMPGFQLKPRSQVLRTDMEVGARRVRRISKTRLDFVSALFRFDAAQSTAFRAWFYDDVVSISGASDTIADWGLANTSVLMAESLAPDLVAADRLVETAADNMHYAAKVLPDAATDNLVLALTATLRVAGRTRARLMLVDRAGTQHALNCDLSAGTIIGTNGTPLAMSIRPRGDGWHRVTMEASTGIGAGVPAMRLGLLGPAGEVSYPGTAGYGVDVCEVQARVRTGQDLFLPADADGRALGMAGGAAWARMAVAVEGREVLSEVRLSEDYAMQLMTALSAEVTLAMEVRNA